MPTDQLTCNQRKFLSSANEVAKQMGKNGRSFTGVIGELAAREKLRLMNLHASALEPVTA